MGNWQRTKTIFTKHNRVTINRSKIFINFSRKNLILNIFRYPIGGDTDYSHFVVEIHYNNPKLAIGWSKFLVYTKK